MKPPRSLRSLPPAGAAGALGAARRAPCGMANKQALRDLQTRLADRLQAARTEPLGRSWLAVECSSRGFLFPLRDAGEIFAMTPLLHVPHSHRWFLGVANLRGHLHGVVD